MEKYLKPILIGIVVVLATLLLVQGVGLITGMVPGAQEDVVLTVKTGNVAPIIWNLRFNSLNAPSACANSTNHLIVNFTLTDANGHQNITSYTLKAYNANTTTSAACTATNLSKCYYTASPATGICTNTTYSVTTVNVSCDFGAVTWYANNGTWWLNGTVSDGIVTTGYNDSTTDSTGSPDTLTMASLIALDANDTIDFGTVNPGSVSSAITDNVSNCGNYRIDTKVNATSLPCNGIGTILYDNVTAGITAAANDVTLGLGPASQTLDTNISAGVPGTDKPFGTTFWKINVPNGVAGTCTGTATFIAVSG